MKNICRRARSDEQKAARREEILQAAGKLLMKINYAEITLQKVAKEAGIVKGTLYLYFKTKEELFLSLLQLETKGLLQGSMMSLGQVQTDEDLLQGAAKLFSERPLLLRLLGVTTQILEHNISLERATEFKMGAHEGLNIVGKAMEKKAPWMKPGQGREFMMHIYSYAQGLWPIYDPAPVMLELYKKHPHLQISTIEFQEALARLAKWIYQGMKAEAEA